MICSDMESRLSFKKIKIDFSCSCKLHSVMESGLIV